ncbi:MAG: nuclear transport factor 2 family protein [Burkholderiaceae bacterium]
MQIVSDKLAPGRGPDHHARILQLLSDYVHCIDDGRYEEWPEFFCDPCSYRIVTRASLQRGYEAGIIDCESKGMLIDRVSSLRRANIYEPHVYRHLLGPTRVSSGTVDEVSARTGFVVMRTVEGQSTEPFVSGVYDDRFVYERGELRIAERLVVLDSSCVDTLLVIPL